VVKASTNVLIDVVLTNVSGHDPGISDCILQELNYHIEVSKEDGKSAQLTSFGHQLYVKPIDQSPLMSKMSRAVELLKPGQTVKPTLLASRVYDLSQSGVYKLQVERRIPFTDTFVKSNVITVTVTP
jgi:hypothetical protein